MSGRRNAQSVVVSVTRSKSPSSYKKSRKTCRKASHDAGARLPPPNTRYTLFAGIAGIHAAMSGGKMGARTVVVTGSTIAHLVSVESTQFSATYPATRFEGLLAKLQESC